MIDEATPLGARILTRLREERVIWLTTVDRAGPRPAPVWFLYERTGSGERIVFYSKTDGRRNANIEANPNVALNFNCSPDGDDVQVILGTARLAPELPPGPQNEAYMARYDEAIRSEEAWQRTPEEFAAQYSVPVEITGLRVWGW